MPVWGDHRITWRQVLPPVLVAVAVACLALAARNCTSDGVHGVSTSEQYNFYIAQLDSADPAAAATAIKYLGNAGDPRAIEPIRARLSDGDPRVVGAACAALGKLGGKTSADRMLALLGSEQPGVAAGAAEGLGALRHKAALEPLVKLLDTTDAATRKAVFVSLGQLGEPAAMQALERFQSDPASGLDPEPTAGERTQLGDALAQALTSLRSAPR